MKIRGLLCGALLLSTLCSLSSHADESVITLEVTPSSPAPGSPGSWELFGRIVDTGIGADGSLGFSAIRALLLDIDFGTDGDAVTIAAGIGAINPIDEGGPNERNPVLQLSGGVIDVLYGQNISSTGTIVPFVGTTGDALVAFGTYSAGQSPRFGMDGNLSTDALYLTSLMPGGGPAIDDDATFTVVRVIPEPTSLALLLIGGVACISRRQSR